MLSLIVATCLIQFDIRLVPLKSPTELSSAVEQALRQSIGDRRIVLLGELTHGDAESHAIKVATVRFLHEKMGFDVLIWESGLYDCHEMNRELGGNKSIRDVARIGVFPHWSQGAEAFPVFEYARSTIQSKRPLTMAGFDIQGSGTASYTMFRDFVDWFGADSGLTAEDRKAVDAAFAKAMEAGKKPDQPALMQEAIRDTYATTDRFLGAYKKNRTHLDRKWGAESSWRLRALENAKEYGNMLERYQEVSDHKAHLSIPYNLREQGNSENLRWLADTAFPKRKLIVWAHNVHIFKGLPGRKAGVQAKPVDNDLDATGRLFAKSHGKEMTVIGLMAGGGTWSWLGGAPIAYRASSSGSIETLLGKSLGYIDLRSLPKDHILRKPLPGTIDQQNPFELTAIWPDGFDALFYVPTMTPRKNLAN